MGVVLAAVLGEVQRFDASGDGGEGPSGVDFGELAGVADEDELGVGSVGFVDEAGELAGADHSGFVDDEHGSPVELEVPGGELVERAVDGLGVDACTGTEFGCGSGGQGGADHSVVVAFVRVS